MGCQPSSIQPMYNDQQDDFILSYRDFIFNNRGEVFESYHFSRMISRSLTSIIRRVIHRTTKIERVCKIVPLKEEKHISALQEVEILKKIDHPNIVRIHQYFFERDYLYIILEEIQGQKIINEILNFGEINIQDIVHIVRQLLSTVDYCHQQGIAHRALNLENILLVKSKNNNLLKIVDFANAAIIGCPNPYQKYPTLQKTTSFTAPEGHDIKMDMQDIWCCGLLLFTLLTGQKPDKSIRQNPKRKIQLKRNKKNSKMMQLGLDLVALILDLDPNKRPTAHQCLNHQFLKTTPIQQQNTLKYQNMFYNLASLKISDKLTSLFWMYASLNLTTSKNKSQYIAQFYNLDKNKDGKLSFDEMVEGIENTFNLSHQKAIQITKEIFKSIDRNHNGCLDYSQFMMGTTSVSSVISQESLRKMFDEIDSNKNGLIEEEQINEMINGIQQFSLFENTNHQITFKQFRSLMEKVLIDSRQRKKINIQ